MGGLETFLQARDALIGQAAHGTAAAAGFQWPRIPHFNWALDYFDQIDSPDRVALWLVDEQGAETKRTFADLRRRSGQVANLLRRLGIGRGDRILLMLGNVVPLWETMLAAMKLGAVVIPSTTLLGRDDLADRLARGRVRAVVASAQDAARFEGLVAGLCCIAVGGQAPGWHAYDEAAGEPDSFVPDGPTAAEDPLLLYFTSGTTAKAKLVLHSHASYPIGHLSTMYWLGLRPGDIHLNISSPGWAKHAWSCFFAPWNAGATIFIHAVGRFHAAETLRVIAGKGVTSLCAPPTVWRLFVQEDLAAYPVKLRSLASAGEPLNPEIIETVRARWGLDVRDGYGQTETTALIGNAPGEPIRPGSMGRPLPGYRVVLLDLEDQEAQEGEVALDLQAGPLGLMLGYEEGGALRRPSDRGRYYRTGDVATRDQDGMITFVGRADDVFKAADYRISPFELESILIEHEAVAEAAVVPSPDPIRLAVPKAYLALVRGYEPGPDTARSIFAHIRAHMSPFKRVRRIEFCELPKTISGKIRRVDLRRQETERQPGPGNGPSAQDRAPGEYWEEDFADPGPGSRAR